MIRRWHAVLEPAFRYGAGYGFIAGVLFVSVQGVAAALLGLLLLGVGVLASLGTLVRPDVVRQTREERSQVAVAKQIARLS